MARKRGIYFALLTIAFGTMFWFSVFVLDAWTGGEDGLTGISRLAVGIPGLFRSRFGITSPSTISFSPLRRPHGRPLAHRPLPFGQVIQAIKQSESRASALGYDTARYKWAVFTMSCAFAGFAGGLYSLARFGAFPEPMSLHQSGNVVLMCLVGGGFASFYGPVLGVAVFLVLRDLFSTLTDHWMLLYGFLFMAIILFLPEGILGLTQRKRRPVSSHDTGVAQSGPRRGCPLRGTPMSASEAPLLEARGLRKAFGGNVVLDDVNLQFQARRVSALIGPNGAGQDHVLQYPHRRPGPGSR